MLWPELTIFLRLRRFATYGCIEGAVAFAPSKPPKKEEPMDKVLDFLRWALDALRGKSTELPKRRKTVVTIEEYDSSARD
jgi:hypothetical protein